MAEAEGATALKPRDAPTPIAGKKTDAADAEEKKRSLLTRQRDKGQTNTDTPHNMREQPTQKAVRACFFAEQKNQASTKIKAII